MWFDQEISMHQTRVASVATGTGERAASNGGHPAYPPRALLAIAEHRVGRRAVLSVAGEVDISTAADLRTAIETAGTRAFEVWVDLSETTFMDSSGLHAMAHARARLADANIRLALICTDGPVLRVLKLSGFDRIFEIHPSRSDANHAASA
jgi:anti-sigma B factor antagonist